MNSESRPPFWKMSVSFAPGFGSTCWVIGCARTGFPATIGSTCVGSMVAPGPSLPSRKTTHASIFAWSRGLSKNAAGDEYTAYATSPKKLRPPRFLLSESKLEAYARVRSTPRAKPDAEECPKRPTPHPVLSYAPPSNVGRGGMSPEVCPANKPNPISRCRSIHAFRKPTPLPAGAYTE